MKPPKCRVCGLEEWRHVCARPSAVSVVKPVSRVANGVANGANSSAGGKGETARVEEWREKNRERYNERQRAAAKRYREKRRAAARAGLEA